MSSNPNQVGSPTTLQEAPSVPVRLDEKTSQLQLEPIELKAPVYKYLKLNPYSGGTAPALGTAPTQIQWQIAGSKVFNLHETFVVYDILFPAPGANSVTNVYVDTIHCDSIQYVWNDTQVIGDITKAYNYTKVAQALALDMEDYETRGPCYGDTAIGTAYPISQSVGCQPIGDNNIIPVSTNAGLYSTAAAGAAAAIPLLMTCSGRRKTTALAGAGAYAVDAANYLVNNLPSDAYMVDDGGAGAGGPGYARAMSVSAFPATNVSGTDIPFRGAPQRLISSGVNAAMTLRMKVPFKAFVGTILALNKNLHFGETTQIYFNFPDYRVYGFASQVDGTTGAVELAAPTVSNLSLYLAEDTNLDNIEQMRAMIKTGYKIACPYTIYKQGTLPTASAGGSVQDTFSSSKGLALKRVLAIPTIANATVSQRCNTFNVNAVKFLSVYSTLGGNKVQEFELKMSDSSLWNYLRESIRRSPSGQSQRTFEENCFFLDNWSDSSSSTDWYENDSKLSGLQMSNESQIYSLEVARDSTNNKLAGINFDLYSTWARVLVVNANGVGWAKVA